jgi:hypothetical protein
MQSLQGASTVDLNNMHMTWQQLVTSCVAMTSQVQMLCQYGVELQSNMHCQAESPTDMRSRHGPAHAEVLPWRAHTLPAKHKVHTMYVP